MNAYLLAMVLARALDTTSTVVAMQQPGLTEGTPWMPSHPAGAIAVQAGITTGQVYLYHRIGKTRPKVAKGLSLLQVGFSGTAITLNVLAIRKVR